MTHKDAMLLAKIRKEIAAVQAIQLETSEPADGCACVEGRSCAWHAGIYGLLFTACRSLESAARALERGQNGPNPE